MSYPWPVLVQFILLVLSIFWFAKRKDEFPLIGCIFLFYVFSFRYLALVHGSAFAVDLTPYGFTSISNASAGEVLQLAVVGQCVMFAAYFWFQSVSFARVRPALSLEEGRWLSRFFWWLMVICIPIVFLARGMLNEKVGSGLSMGFQISSYLFLFPFVLISMGILTAALWKTGQFHTNGRRIIGLLLFAGILWLTFGASARFLFIGWMLGATIIFAAGLPTSRAVVSLIVGVAFTITLFAAGGALRNKDAVEERGIKEGAWERFISAEDANMLDGFAFLQQVYPSRLDYTYGLEHLGIFLRPIPRAWWPGKPVGSYMNQLGLIDADSGMTLGISPSLFGSFYQEGGWGGIVLFSAFYGWVFARLMVLSSRIHPFAGVLIRAILCAFIIPLMRGGDLPGIYAWFGMAFWPCLLIFWLRRKEWFRIRKPVVVSRKPSRRRSVASSV